MKKTYSKPVTEVINIETSKILCASGPDRWGGEFGYIPGLTPGGGNHLA